MTPPICWRDQGQWDYDDGPDECPECYGRGCDACDHTGQHPDVLALLDQDHPPEDEP